MDLKPGHLDVHLTFWDVYVLYPIVPLAPDRAANAPQGEHAFMSEEATQYHREGQHLCR